jgi:GPH family glycoside/pentoside/hexuronide:cation symporter
MNESNVEPVEISRHPKWKFGSNATWQFTGTFLGAAQTVFLMDYYTNILSLNAWYVVLAMVIFTVYDALNDPIVGYLLDRNTRLTKRWGRRFPWIVIGSVPFCLAIWLLFSAPSVGTSGPWPVFLWLLVSLLVFDTFGTIVTVNISALRPDLFRTEGERRTLSGFFAFFDMIAQALGMLIPPLFLGAGARADFAFMGALVAVIALISVVGYLPGMKEDKVVIDRYYSSDYEKMGLFKGMKEVYKQKSFIFFFIGILSFHTATTLLTANSLFIIRFVIQDDPEMLTPIFAALLSGALLSIIFWRKLLKKMNDAKKVLSIGGIAIAASVVWLSFTVSLIDLIILVFIVGFCTGAMWSFFFPIIEANVMDDYVVRTGKNQKGVLAGAASVLHRVTAFIDELLFAIVFTLTGFVAGNTTYAELATDVAAAGGNINLVIWGLRLLMGIIPMIIILTGTLIFWKYYPLTPELVLENKQKLKELGF